MSDVTSNPLAAETLPYQSAINRSTRRGAAFWIGWILSGLLAAAFLMGGVMDILKPPFVVEGVTRAGYREEVIVPLGIVTVISVLLFLVPRTVMFGAVLLTAYLGGAVSTHMRMGEYGQMFAPVVFAVVMWISLVLRDRRIRTAVFG